MKEWIPSVVEALVFLCSLVGILVKTSNRINTMESKQEMLEKRVSDMAVNVVAVQAGFAKIETSLARIETDLSWLKDKEKRNEESFRNS